MNTEKDYGMQMEYAHYCFEEDGKLSYFWWLWLVYKPIKRLEQLEEWWCGWYQGHHYECYYFDPENGPQFDEISCRKCGKRLM